MKINPVIRKITASLTILFLFLILPPQAEAKQPPGAGEDIQIEIFNTDSNDKIKALEEQLSRQDIILACDHIKRDKQGTIQKMHITLTTHAGTVEGNYTDFSSIKIFQSAKNGFGISPVKGN